MKKMELKKMETEMSTEPKFYLRWFHLMKL